MVSDAFDSANLPAPRKQHDPETLRQAFALMQQRGGRFCTALGDLWFAADEAQRGIILTSFTKHIDRYVDDLRYIAPEARP
jgi:hypothetical protein